MYLNGIVIVKKELNEPGSQKLGTEIPGNRRGTQSYILGYPRLKRENLRKVWALCERKLKFCVGGTHHEVINEKNNNNKNNNKNINEKIITRRTATTKQTYKQTGSYTLQSCPRKHQTERKQVQYSCNVEKNAYFNHTIHFLSLKNESNRQHL